MERRPSLAAWVLVFALFECCRTKEHKKNYIDGPPRLVAPVPAFRRLVSAGTTIHLPCPVEASDPGSLIFEWSKDRRPINLFGSGQRFRIGHKGTLKIRETLAEDTGHYVCRAVNGFGSVEFNATLIVLADYDYDDQQLESDHHYKFGSGHRWKDENRRPSDPLTGSKPAFIHSNKFRRTVIHRPVGGSLLLKCFASGYPRPQVTWLRNNVTIRDSLLFPSSASKRSRWTLHLTDLNIADSGNYTCIVHNNLGSINATFVVEVTEETHSKPEVLAFQVANKTVEEGSEMRLTCQVRSNQMPHIQWLKGVSEYENTRGMENRHSMVKLQGESFHILKSSTDTQRQDDGSFVNEFAVEKIRIEDSGKYVCLAANTKGYSSKNIFIVSHKKSNLSTNLDANGNSLMDGILPLYYTVPGGIGIVTALLVVIFIVCQRRRRSRPVPVRITSSETPHVQPRQFYPKGTAAFKDPASGMKTKTVHFQKGVDLRPFSAHFSDNNSIKLFENALTHSAVGEGSANSYHDEHESPLIRRSELLFNHGSIVSRVQMEPIYAETLPVAYRHREQFGTRSDKWNHNGISEGSGTKFV